MRTLRTLFAATLLAAAAHPALAQMAAPGTLPDTAARRLAASFDSIARSAMDEQAIPGMSIAVVKDGRVLAERGYGWASLEKQVPATAATQYQVASVGKQFTAAAVLRLVEQGRLSLGDPVTRYVDGLPREYADVTLERLLNHTAGVPNFTEFFRDFHQPITGGQMVDSLRARPLDFVPGSGFHYSNSGYWLLGLVLERVTGQAYADYLREQFFIPLGMADTHPCAGQARAPLPEGYWRGPRRRPVKMPPWHGQVLFAAGSMCSTAADLARWEVALGGGQVLSGESFRMMTTPAPPAEPSVRMSYGFAMMVDSIDGMRYLHHDGAVPGFRSQVAYYPDAHLAVVVLANLGLAAPEPVERDLSRAVLGSAPALAAAPPAAGAKPRMTEFGRARIDP